MGGSGFVEILESLADFEDLTGALKDKITPINVMGVAESIRSHLIFCVCQKLGVRSLVVAPSEVHARQIYDDLNFFDKGNVLLFPRSDLLFYDIEAAGHDITGKRLGAINKLMNNKKRYHVVTTAEALFSVTVPKKMYENYALRLKVGDEISHDELTDRMITLGYRREEMVEGAGQFSLRGGIFDFYPYWSETAYRIEFFDTEIDSIRLFDIESQRTISKVNETLITPADEIIIDEKTRLELILTLEKLAEKAEKAKKNIDIQKKLTQSIRRDIERLTEGISFPSIYKYIPFIYPDEKPTLLEYIEEDSIVFWDEPSRISESFKADKNRLEENCLDMLERGIIPKSDFSYTADYPSLVKELVSRRFIGMSALSYTSPDYKPQKLVSFTTKSLNDYKGKMEFFYDALDYYRKNNYRVVILAGSETRAKNLAEQFESDEISSVYAKKFNNLPEQGHILITHGSLSRGFEYPLIRTVVISDKEIFGSEKKKGRRNRISKNRKLENFTDLNVGDYIVHQNHGIGQYIGIEQLVVEGVKKDYLKIRYKGDDLLYVPTDQLDLVYKHAFKDGTHIKVNKLGGTEWSRTKQRVKASCADMAKELINLYAQRESVKGIAFESDSEWQKDFETTFPYDETVDQLRSIDEVKEDMEKPKPMDRLLCGDVGYGKTEVAIRAAFKAVMSGYQVAYLVPTTILANQHYNTFRQRMKDYPIRIAMLSRFCTSSQQKSILKELKSGEIDIVIGTHKILQKSVRFNELGLLIIDEEQRFGVTHKEQIKEMRKEVDVLTLSATPIPRTLHMSMTGIRDMSVLNEPPGERYPVATYVLEYNEDVIREAINKELSRGGQVYYLFNRVQGINKVVSRIAEMVPDARVSVAHGQMNETELENIMMDLSEGEIDILVCTTIIETGLDIPNVNTIIIEDSDRLGLSQLYQLRGRVGRSNRLAYAYLTFRRDKVLNEDAEKRLRAIKEFTEFGSGFKIALRDLEIRGAGNIIGAQQSGHMEAVGYEMYCRLLEEAVNEQRGIESIKKTETLIDLPISAYIPEDYISMNSQRISIYKKIASIESQDDLYDVYDEIEDRYGEVPQVVHNLMEIALLKAYASKYKITEISGRKEELVMFFNANDAPNLQRCIDYMEKNPNRIFIKNGAKPSIIYIIKNDKNIIKYLNAIKELLCFLNNL